MSFHHPHARRTLIVGPSDLDEAVLAQPLIASLRHYDPRGRIDCLAPAASAPVFRAMNEIDEVLETAVSDHQLRLAVRIRLALQLARRHYDVAWVLPLPRTAAIAPWLARIPCHLGTNRPTRRRGDGIRRRPAAGGSLARWFAMLPYTSLGLPAPDPAFAAQPPKLGRPPPLAGATRLRLALDHDRQLFLLSPGSAYGASSRWPARHFVALANLIHGRWPLARIASVGRDEDREIGRHLHLLSGGRIDNWIGTVDIDQTMAVMTTADAIVGGESPFLHLAAAAPRPGAGTAIRVPNRPTTAAR